MVGNPREWNQDGGFLQALKLSGEALHCVTEGKLNEMQDEHFEYLPSSFTAYSMFSAVKNSITACCLFCTENVSSHYTIFTAVIQRYIAAKLWKCKNAGKSKWTSAVQFTPLCRFVS
jgi:hypothetical protein